MLCAAYTTSTNKPCKNGITSGCTIREGDHLYFLCRSHFAHQDAINDWVPGRSTHSPQEVTPQHNEDQMALFNTQPKEEVVAHDFTQYKVCRLFTIVGVKTTNGVKNYYFSKYEDITYVQFTEVVEATQSPSNRPTRLRGFIAQEKRGTFMGTRKVKIDTAGGWSVMDEPEAVLVKDKLNKK